MKHIDLFSGIGGFALAASRVWNDHEVVSFVEKDKYCQKVLKKHWPMVPISEDIYEFKGQKVNLITGGFPCQPFSCAGKQRGTQDDRYLWPEMLRVIRESKPEWVVGENVTGIIGMALDQTITDLEDEDYTVSAFIIPACAVDAPHQRNRVWIVGQSDGPLNAEVAELQDVAQSQCRCGNTGGERIRREAGPDTSWGSQGAILAELQVMGHAPCDTKGNPRGEVSMERKGVLYAPRWKEKDNEHSGPSQNVADTQGDRLQGIGSPRQQEPDTRREEREPQGHGQYCEWPTEPNVGRVANGIPKRVDRLRGLGNAIVPQVAEEIFWAIKEN